MGSNWYTFAWSNQNDEFFVGLWKYSSKRLPSCLKSYKWWHLHLESSTYFITELSLRLKKTLLLQLQVFLLNSMNEIHNSFYVGLILFYHMKSSKKISMKSLIGWLFLRPPKTTSIKIGYFFSTLTTNHRTEYSKSLSLVRWLSGR